MNTFKKSYNQLNDLILFLTISIIFCFCNFSNSQIGYSQTSDKLEVQPEVDLSLFNYNVPEKPEFHAYKKELEHNEKHILGSLTPEERLFLEVTEEPPRIGILRKLKEQIRFNIREIEIPQSGEITTSGGRLSRINDKLLVFTTFLQSTNANEIRIFFEEGNFPDSVKVNLFSRDNYAFNQYELKGKLNEYGFYTTTTFSDYVIIQVEIPVETLEEDLNFVISGIIHVENIYFPEENQVDCYQDVNCSYAGSYSGIETLKKSVAKLTFLSGSGYYLCSGGLVNDSRNQDFQPFLITAYHCFSTQQSANSLEARFDFHTTSCNGPNNPAVILVNGSNLLKTNSQTDFTMVLLKRDPMGPTGRAYLGWTTEGVGNNAILHSVHHPSGTSQKYSRHQNKLPPNIGFYCEDIDPNYYCYTVTQGGQTLGGSSGGIIALPTNQIVGQLYGWCGTNDMCCYSCYYNLWGKFNVSYQNLNLGFYLYNGGSSVNMLTNPTSTVNFGPVAIGYSLDRTVNITNNGTVPNYLNLEANSVTISGANSNQFSILGSSSLYMAPQESGTFTVRFTPTSSGLKTANLNIYHNANNITSPKVITLAGGTTSISTISSIIPEKYNISQNYPNPFNPVTKIRFDIAESGLVRLTVYNLLGKEVAELVNENLTAGSYESELNGSNLASGVYFYKIEANDFVEIRKMIINK